MRYVNKIAVVLLACMFLFSSSLVPHPSSLVYAAVPHLINYQGKLTDKTGKPVSDTAQSITFRIYDAESGGSLLWQETQSVTTQKGVFNVLLGSVTNLDIAFDKPYWLEIKVAEEVMSPRQRITSSGYAMRAEKADDTENFSGLPKTYYLDHSNMTGLNNNDHPQYAKGKETNMRIDYGFISSINGGQAISVSFNVTFSSPPAVVISNAKNIGNDEHGTLSVYNVTNTGCTIQYNRPNNDGGARSVYWIAIGQGS